MLVSTGFERACSRVCDQHDKPSRGVEARGPRPPDRGDEDLDESSVERVHAEGDEQVPYTVSQELHAAAQEPKRLLILPGGHHRSLQHDPEMQGESLRFIARAAG